MAVGTLFPIPRFTAFSDGVYAPGAKLYLYEAGTSTPKDSWSDEALTSVNSNPVVAAADGTFGPIYLSDSGSYKAVLQTSGGASIWTQDNIDPVGLQLLRYIDNSVCDGRLTLESGVPVSTSDQTAKTTVYFTPYRGSRIALYDGTQWSIYTFSELSVSLSTDAASLPYDLYAYLNGSTVAIERLAWTNGTTRATALTTQNGVLVKSGDPTRRYLGTYRTTSTIGQTEDSVSKRFVWNYYHRASRQMTVEDTSSWTYTTATWRQANGATANKAEFVIGVAEDPVVAEVSAHAANSVVSNISTFASVGVGVDSITAPTDGHDSQQAYAYVAAIPCGARAAGAFTVAAGYHYVAWLEYANQTNGGTWTWYGREPFAALLRGGLRAVVWG